MCPSSSERCSGLKRILKSLIWGVLRLHNAVSWQTYAWPKITVDLTQVGVFGKSVALRWKLILWDSWQLSVLPALVVHKACNLKTMLPLIDWHLRTVEYIFNVLLSILITEWWNTKAPLMVIHCARECLKKSICSDPPCLYLPWKKRKKYLPGLYVLFYNGIQMVWCAGY